MDKMSKYIDYGVLITIGIFISISINLHLTQGYVLALNFGIGCILWVLTIVFRLVKQRKSKYLVLTLLVMYTSNIVNFTAATIKIGYDANSGQYEGLTLNPLALLILIIYVILNRRLIKGIYTETEDETSKNEQKKIMFYYQKFSSCSAEELTGIYNNYNNYPKEAQAALDKLMIKSE